MAVSPQDISLVFGLDVRKTEQQFKTQLGQVVDKLNANTSGNYKKIALTLDESKTSRNLQSSIKNVLKDVKTKNSFTIEISKISADSAIRKLKEQLSNVVKTLSVGSGLTMDFESATDPALTAKIKTLQDLQASLSNAYKSATNLKTGITNSEELAEVTRLYTEWNEKVGQVARSSKELSDAEVKGYQESASALIDKIRTVQQAQAEEQRAAKATATAKQNEEKETKKQIDLERQVITLRQQIRNYLDSNSNLKGTSQEARLNTILQELNSTGSITTQRLSEIRTEFTGIKEAAQLAGSTGRTFFDSLQRVFKNLGGPALATRSFYALTRVFRDMVSSVREVDAAMTELRKVTEETDTAYTRFLERAEDRSKRIGATLTDTISATADFARLGYTLTESENLADVALIYKNVGDGITDIGTASESVISTLRAFGIAAEDAMLIVDKFNEVGNNFAISSKGVGDALVRSAAALSAAGNTIDESIALITAANSVVQDPDKVGTTMKTLSMYLRAAKTEAQEAGESTDGMAESVSSLRGQILALTGGKVDIQIDED